MSFFNNIIIPARLFASLTVLTIILFGIVAIAIIYNQQLSKMTTNLAEINIQGQAFII